MENYYAILEIANFSSEIDIKLGFRKLAKQVHPDIQGGDREKFERIRFAYEILSDQSMREAFDKKLKFRLAEEKKEAARPGLARVDIATKLEIILAYSTTRKTFRPHFANSCLNQLAEGRKLSEKQIIAIDNVILSFQIDLDSWMDEDKRRSALEEFFKIPEPEAFSAFSPED
jgi:curved DNA-binding protein CbpA